jgi:hypothetical protein
MSRVPRYSRYQREPAVFRLRDSHPLRSPLPAAFGYTSGCSLAGEAAVSPVGPSNPTHPTPAGSHRCMVSAAPGSFATTTGILSFPRGTEMFQFPRLPRAGLCVHPAVTAYHHRRVAPFGFPRLTACPQLPEAFRRVATSFIGRRRQGIHRALSAQSYSDDLERIARLDTSRFLTESAQDQATIRLLLSISSVVNVPGGAAGIRTPDLRRAKAALSRLSYSPSRSASPSGRSWTRTTGLTLIRGVL